MVTENQSAMLEQILDILDTSCQASLELLRLCSEKNQPSANRLLGDLDAVVHTVHSASEPMRPQLEYAYTAEMLENVESTLGDIQCALQQGNCERAAAKAEYQLFPFLRQLREAFYFWGTIYPDRERMARYYQNEFAEHYRNYYVKDFRISGYSES